MRKNNENYRFFGLLIIIITFLILLSGCAEGTQKTLVTILKSETPLPQVSEPKLIDLIDLSPVKSYGSVLAFGEDDLIRQNYGTFKIQGLHYPKSIFAPAPSVIEYKLDGQYDWFSSILMMMPCYASNADGSFFVIELDGEVVFRSDQLNYDSEPLPVKLRISGSKFLRLEAYSTPNIGVTDPNGDCDVPVWGDPYLIADEPVLAELQSEVENVPAFSSNLIPGEVMAEFYISPNGSDTNPGSKEFPFATLEHSRNVVRTINQDMSGPIKIYIAGGTYQIDRPFELNSQDSGTNGYDIIYQAVPGEVPVISGGIGINGWKTVTDKPYWVLKVPDSVEPFRNLYVNGERAIRAQTESVIAGVDFWKGDWSDRDGIIYDKNGSDWWVSDWSDYPESKVISSPSKLPSFSRPQDLELHWNYEWMDVRAPVETITPLDDSRSVIVMTQPYFSWAQNMRYIGWDNWPEPGGHFYEPSWDRPFFIENALELMDTPGEWYYNETTNELFYFPKVGELPEPSITMIPQLEQLVVMRGSGIDREVHNIKMVGLTFAYNSWTRASVFGTAGGFAEELVDGECALFSCEAQEFTPSSFRLEHARDIQLLNNTFIHLGSVGLGLDNNVFKIKIIGNSFRDISDAAITMGHGADHAELDKPDEALVREILINNNLVYRVGVEYWSAHAIIGYFVRGVTISHNQIQNAPNSGISFYNSGFANTNIQDIGNNNMLYNRIEGVSLRGKNGAPMIGGDAGALYFGGNQEDSSIRGNYVTNVVNHYGCIYLDLANNNNISIQKNVCERSPMWLVGGGESINVIAQDNYTDTSLAFDFYNPTIVTADSPFHDNEKNFHIVELHYFSDANWPAEALEIIENSGLEKEYQYLLDLIPQ